MQLSLHIFDQSVELFESAGFSTHGLQMVKEEVDYWTKKFARSFLNIYFDFF